jgi:nucleotide-binding universal stress UspA family protein
VATLLHEHAHKKREFAHRIVEEFAAALRKKFPAHVIHKDVRIGCPKEVILSTAAKWNADTIVVGSHGKSKLGRMMMGSVSSSILADAKCTVIVVRPPAVVAAPKRRSAPEKVTV